MADTEILAQEELFSKLDDYPWETDEEFQSGLSAILGPAPPPEQAGNLALRARCFYYSRKFNVSIDFPAYQTWHSSNLSASAGSAHSTGTEQDKKTSSIENSGDASENPPQYPTSFKHIVELITSGQTIPGIKEIPDTVLEGQESHSANTQRKKPWEKSAE